MMVTGRVAITLSFTCPREQYIHFIQKTEDIRFWFHKTNTEENMRMFDQFLHIFTWQVLEDDKEIRVMIDTFQCLEPVLDINRFLSIKSLSEFLSFLSFQELL